jgi:hypothetical protein
MIVAHVAVRLAVQVDHSRTGLSVATRVAGNSFKDARRRFLVEVGAEAFKVTLVAASRGTASAKEVKWRTLCQGDACFRQFFMRGFKKVDSIVMFHFSNTCDGLKHTCAVSATDGSAACTRRVKH